MEDNEILALLFARDEQGLKELEQKYGIRLKHLAMGILPEEDALECLNDTYLAVWNSIPPKQPELTTLHTYKTRFTKTALKWGAVAAAAVIFLGGGIAYAAKYGIFRTNPGWESGYHVSITSRRVTEEEFSEEVRAVKQELLEDIAAAEEVEKTPWFGWIQDFNSVEESVQFIGHAGMKAPVFPGTLEQTGVTVLGDNTAKLLQVRAFARYSLDKMSLNGTATVYTAAMLPETGAGIKDDGLIYKDEIYITSNGKEAVIVMPTEYYGNSGIQGYLVEDSVIYELWILCYEEDHNQAMKLMKEWLDQF